MHHIAHVEVRGQLSESELSFLLVPEIELGFSGLTTITFSHQDTSLTQPLIFFFFLEIVSHYILQAFCNPVTPFLPIQSAGIAGMQQPSNLEYIRMRACVRAPCSSEMKEAKRFNSVCVHLCDTMQKATLWGRRTGGRLERLKKGSGCARLFGSR